jgi:2-iminobutanoate/2-iminopropanoate deaminase
MAHETRSPDMSSHDPPTPMTVGPYTPVVRAGDWLVCSGQLALREGVLIEGGVAEQVSQCVANLAALLEGQGASLQDVVKTTVFLSGIEHYAEMNEAYVAAFGAHRPARSAFAVAGLPLGALVEIEAWAHLEQGP